MNPGGQHGPLIVRGLQEAAQALDEGRVEAAAEALAAVESACLAAEAAAERLPDSELQQARELYGRLQQLSQRSSQSLSSSLLQSARVRSAAHAYRSS